MKRLILAISTVLLVFAVIPLSAVLATGTGITVTPSVPTVAPGTAFTVTLVISNDGSIYAWQCGLTFDAAKLTCGTVTEGNFLKSAGTTVSPVVPSVDNTAGTVTNIAYSLTGVTGAASGSSGTLLTINFTAKTGVSGVASIAITNPKVYQLANGDTNLIQNLTTTNASVSIAADTTTTSTTTTATTTATTTTAMTTPTTTTPTTTTTTAATTTPTSSTTSSTWITHTSTIPATTTTTSTTTTTQVASAVIKTSTTTTTRSTTNTNGQNTNSNISSIDLSNNMDGGGVLLTNMQKMNVLYGGNVPIYDMEIPSGTRALKADGSPLDMITMQPATQLLAPDGKTIVSSIQFGPSGATFSQPIAITFQYDTSQLPQGINMNNLSVQYYDSAKNKWEPSEYTVDADNHRIVALISHFSTYAVLGGSTIKGFGWSIAGTIIILELLVGVAFIYLFMRRGKPLTPVAAAALAQSSAGVSSSSSIQVPYQYEQEKPVRWEDVLKEKTEIKEKYTAQVEIIGGKIIIPGYGKTSDIEIINTGGARVMISLEYDPNLDHQNAAKIIIPSKIAEYDKVKEK